MFGVSLTQQVADANPPLYQGEERIPWLRERMRKLLRQPLGRQRDFLKFVVNALVGKHDGQTIRQVGKIAEMATGKTFLSLASAYLADEQVPCFPMLVLCPPILARKWKREAEMTIPGVKAVIVRSLSTQEDAREFREFDTWFTGKELSSVGCLERVIERIRTDLESWEELCAYIRKKGKGLELPPKPLHIMIITSSTAKLGMEWEPVYSKRVLRGPDALRKIHMLRSTFDNSPVLAPHCCSCGMPLKIAKEKKVYNEDGEEEVSASYLSEKDLLGSGENRKK